MSMIQQIANSSSVTICQLPFPLVVVNKDLEIVAISNAAKNFFGFSTKSPGHFNDLPLDKTQTTGLFETGKPFKEVVPMDDSNNSVRWIRIHAHPVQEKEPFFHIYFEEYTSEKLEFNLNLKAQRVAQIGSWSLNLLKNVVYWSDVTKDIHEVPHDFEVDLEKAAQFYKEGDHRDKIIRAARECIASGKPFDEELILVTAKGNEKWVRFIGDAERVNGRTVGVYGIFQDIDQAKRQELELQDLYHRHEVAMQSANIGIWENNLVTNEWFWNQQMYEIFGVDPELEQPSHEIWESRVHPDDIEKARQDLTEAFTNNKPLDGIYRICKPDGSIVHFRGVGKVFRDDDGAPIKVVGVNIDITHIQRKDVRLRKLLDMTERQNKKLIDFAYIISHNVRSSSSNISMLTGMLLSEIGKEQRNEFLKMVQKSSDDLETTLNDLNEIIRIQSHEENNFLELNVHDLLEKVVKEIQVSLNAVEGVLVNEIPEGSIITGNQKFVEDIFNNLISNSIKYRSKERKLKIKVSLQESTDSSTISFTDNGSGLDLERSGKHLFGLYKSFHEDQNAKGVGLFINKNQMETMNGKIEVESQVGVGSTFKLVFPKEEN